MTTTEIVFKVPVSPNLNELAASTSSAFLILRPWYQSEHTSFALKSIASQAQLYVKAIESSLTAAQHGYDIAEEAIMLADMIPVSTEAERQDYLLGMLGVALRGHNNAQQAHDRFRNVRSTVERLITDAKAEQSNSDTVALGDLEKGISVLEKFSSCISVYINWWNMMGMSESAQSTRFKSVVFNYNSLREKAIVNKWRELRQEYVDYSNKIQAIQDRCPEFSEILKASKENSELSNSSNDQPVPPSLVPVTHRQNGDDLDDSTQASANVFAHIAVFFHSVGRRHRVHRKWGPFRFFSSKPK